jgi:hypothetical protein
MEDGVNPAQKIRVAGCSAPHEESLFHTDLGVEMPPRQRVARMGASRVGTIAIA